VPYFIGTSVAAALALMYVFSVSKRRPFNPAITIGIWTARKISTLWAFGYLIAQFLVVVASWQLYQYLTNHHLASKHTPLVGQCLLLKWSVL